jgi:hypothetical protein
MAKGDDIPKTDPSQLEALDERLKLSNIQPRDAQLVERLLRLGLSMASLLQHKNASIISTIIYEMTSSVDAILILLANSPNKEPVRFVWPNLKSLCG